MPIVDTKRAQQTLELLLAFLDHWCYFSPGESDNLRGYLTAYKKSYKSEPLMLMGSEKLVFGPVVVTNMGTRKLLVKLEVTEL